MPPVIARDVPEDKISVLQSALSSPHDDQSKIIIDKAKTRGWLVDEEPPPEISEAESGIAGSSVYGSLGLTRPVLSLAGMATGMDPKEAWEKSGEFVKQAKEQNPKSYALGAATSLLAPFGAVGATGKGIAGALKTASVPKGISTLVGTTIPAAASSGGATMAEGGSLKEVADSVLKGALMNIVVTGGAQVAGTAFKKLLPGLRNIPEDVVDTYSKNKKEVNALIKQKLEGFVPQVVDDVSSRIREVGDGLEKSLTSVVKDYGKPVDVGSVVSEIENQISALGKIKMTPDKRSAVATLKKTLGEFFEKQSVTNQDPYLGTIKKTVSSKKNFDAGNLLEMKRDFQRAAEAVYEGNSAGPINEAYAAIAKKATDALKNQVKGTEIFLKLEQDAIKAKSALGLTGNQDAYNVLGRVKNLMSTLLNPDKIQKGTLDQVRVFDKIYGTNLEESSKLFRAAASLGVGDVISGFKTGARVLAPAAGASMFGPAGFAIGALTQAPPLTRPLITLSNELPGIAGRIGLSTGLQNRIPLRSTKENK